MNLRPPNLIQGLTFDISLAGAADDGEGLVDLVKASLLPVMDEVLAHCDRPGQLRRIEQLEIDLGTVSQDDSASELARRLFDRLTEALQWSLDDDVMADGAGVIDMTDERAAPPGELLLRFLRTGRLAPWLVNQTGDAHRLLLLQVLGMPQALEVMRSAVKDARMLTRLVRQFDAVTLRSVVTLLTDAWPKQARASAPPVLLVSQAYDAGSETDWRGLLQASLAPPTASSDSKDLQHLHSILAGATVPQRLVLQAAWTALRADVRLRLGSGQATALAPQAKADLALILRQRAEDLLVGLDTAGISMMLRLLLAGDDAAHEVEAMFEPPLGQSHDAGLLASIIAGADGDPPEVTAATAAGVDADTLAATVDATDAGIGTASVVTENTLASTTASALLASAWRSFDAGQRDVFRSNRQQLLAEVAVHTGGRGAATLSTQKRSALVLVLRRLAAKLFANFGERWQTSHTEALLNLLLREGFASTSVAPTFANASGAEAAPMAAQELSTKSLTADRQEAMHSAVEPSLALSPQISGLQAASDAVQHTDQQSSQILLERALGALTPAERQAFAAAWQRLSREIVIRTGGRLLSTLGIQQKSDLAQLLRQQAVELLLPLSEKWTPSQTDATISLLLTSEEVHAEVVSMLGGMEAMPSKENDAASADSMAAHQDRAPASHIAALQAALRAEERTNASGSGEGQASRQEDMAMLERTLRSFTPSQHQEFAAAWQRLFGEIASHTGRALSVPDILQRTDLALHLRRLAVETLAPFAGKWTPSHTEATLRLVLTSDDAGTEVATMLAKLAPQGAGGGSRSPLNWSTVQREHPSASGHHAPPQQDQPPTRNEQASTQQDQSPAQHDHARAHVVALQAALRVEEDAAGRQEAQALLERALAGLTLAQQKAFIGIWRHLAGEIDGRAAGRTASMLTALQKDDLAQLLRPHAIELFAPLSDRWTTTYTEAVLKLLLEGDNASAEMESLLAAVPSTTDLIDDPEPSPSAKVEPNRVPLPHIAALQAALRVEEATAASDAKEEWTQESEFLLELVLNGLTPAQREAFFANRQRLSSEIARRLKGGALSTSGPQAKAWLAKDLRPFAAELFAAFGEKWKPAHIEALLESVLADAEIAVKPVTEFGDKGDAAADGEEAQLGLVTTSNAEDATVVNTAIRSPTRDANDAVIANPLPADQQPQVEVDRFNAHHEMPHDRQAGMMLLTRIWRTLDAAQRDAFRTIWQLLSEEVIERVAGRALKTLTALQKNDLAALLQPGVTAELCEFARRWPGAISAEDQIALAQSAAQLALADDDVALVVVSMLKEGLSAANTPSDAGTGLATFHAWRRGKLNIQTQALSLADLRQWLNWWLLHDPQLVNQDCSLMLSAIEAQLQRSEDSVGFMKRVLTSLQSGTELDLEALSRQSHAPVGMTLAEALQSRDTIRLFITGQGAQLRGPDAGEAHQLIRAWLRHQDGDTALFMTAIENHAAQAASPQAFLLEVLRQLIADQPVDLEQLLADGAVSTDAAADNVEITESGPAPQVPSTLPAQLRQALPKRLASAMLQADFASLQIIWPDLVRSHASELAEAARHYLARADVRERLVANTDTAMLEDLLGALSRPALSLVRTILPNSLQYGAMLPSPLSGDAFEQHVMRFAIEQALKPEVDASAWLRGLIGSLQELSDEQRFQLQHAWYEVLRTGNQPTPLLRVFEEELFESSAQVSGASESTVVMLLTRDAELSAAERNRLASMLQKVIAEHGVARQGVLATAMAHREAVERLADAVPGAGMARLFATLRPAVAARLPILLRQLRKTLPISFAAVPALLDRRIWKAIYMAAFADDVTATATPEAWMRAVVSQLASQYGQADAVAWLDKVARANNETSRRAAGQLVPATPTSAVLPAATDPSAVTASMMALAPALAGDAAAVADVEITPEQAMSQMLQPWAEAKPAALPKKPAPAKRSAEEEPPFTGEANIHNAGLVIVIPYVQRLFGILELTVDGKFVSDEAAERAVHLLQYVVTGEESTPEYQLVLNKLLCGIHGGTPIVPGISITEKEKTVIEQMLNGVITHWSALGKTSIAGLRETFLQRQGHLHHEDDAWHLKIPQKSFDMLLDRLPWSFAMTRMPWMAEPLNVTWRG